MGSACTLGRAFMLKILQHSWNDQRTKNRKSMQIRPAQTLFHLIFVSFLMPYFHLQDLISKVSSPWQFTSLLSCICTSAVQACSKMFPPPHPATTGRIPANPTWFYLYHLDFMLSATARTIDYCCSWLCTHTWSTVLDRWLFTPGRLYGYYHLHFTLPAAFSPDFCLTVSYQP